MLFCLPPAASDMMSMAMRNLLHTSRIFLAMFRYMQAGDAALGGMMKKIAITLGLMVASSLMAVSSLQDVPPVPVIECRFAGLLDDGDIGLDRFVRLPLFPGGHIPGNFA